MCPPPNTSSIPGTGTIGYSADSGSSIAGSGRVKLFHLRYTGNKDCSTGAVGRPAVYVSSVRCSLCSPCPLRAVHVRGEGSSRTQAVRCWYVTFF